MNMEAFYEETRLIQLLWVFGYAESVTKCYTGSVGKLTNVISSLIYIMSKMAVISYLFSTGYVVSKKINLDHHEVIVL